MSAHWETAQPDEYPVSREYRDPASVVLELAKATDRSRRKQLRHFLESRPPSEVVPLLVLELDECSEAKRFERIANTLGQIGDPKAFEALARHARTQRRYPGLAVRALARSSDERVVPLLMDLAEFGRRGQRVSAIRALGHMKEVRSVELLARLTQHQSDETRYQAAGALRRMGGYSGLTSLLLTSVALDGSERVRGLLALERTSLGWRSYNAEKALERITRTPVHPLRAEACETLDLLRAQAVLLRPASGDGDHSLLRAAGSSSREHAALLRAADSSESDGAATGIRRVTHTAMRWIRGVFQRT